MSTRCTLRALTQNLLHAASVGVLLSTMGGVASAQSISMEPDDWIKDRAPAFPFELVSHAGRSSVLRIGIRPPDSPSSFYNWQGYTQGPKQGTTFPTGDVFLRGDIYIPEDWQSGWSDTDYVRTSMWGSAMPEETVDLGSYVDAKASFPIIGFTNEGGVGRLEVYNDHLGVSQWVDLPDTADQLNFGGWNTFELRLLPEQKKIEYLLNGNLIYTWDEPLSRDGSTPEQFFQIYLNARNNGQTAFDTYWSRLMAGLVAAPGSTIGSTPGDVLVDDSDAETVVGDDTIIGGSLHVQGGLAGKTIQFLGSTEIAGNVSGTNTSFGFSANPYVTTTIEGNLELENGSNTTGGTIGSPIQVDGNVHVDDTSTFGGNFNVAGTVYNSGTTAPGNSIGVQISGGLAWSETSVYQVEVDAQGNADLVVVLGGTELDLDEMGDVEVSAWPVGGRVKLAHDYAILAAPQLKGLLGIRDTLPYLIPTLSLSPNHNSDPAYWPGSIPAEFNSAPVEVGEFDALLLRLEGDEAALLAAAANSNQLAVAQTLLNASISNDAAAAVFASANQADAQLALTELSGAAYASAGSLFIEDSELLRNTAMDRLRTASALTYDPAPIMSYAPRLTVPVVPDNGPELWGEVIGSWGRVDGNGQVGGREHTTHGLLIGSDEQLDQTWRLGLLAGYSSTSFVVPGEQASARSDNYNLGAYASAELGGLTLKTGAFYTYHDVAMNRSVSLPGLQEAPRGRFDATTLQAFGELGYLIDLGSVTFEPFANLAAVRYSGGSYAESGIAGLQGSANGAQVAFSTIGARVAAEFATSDTTLASLGGMVGWQNAFGDLGPMASHALPGGNTFSVTGSPIAVQGLVVEADAGAEISSSARLGLSYSGRFATDREAHAMRAKLRVTF